MTPDSKGWKGFIYIYFHLCQKQFLKSLKWSLVLTFIMALSGATLSAKNSYQLISVVVDLGLKIAPPLLGFTLSSFALVVGFKDDALMRKLKDHITERGISMYQQIVVTFIAMLVSVFLCLLLCVVLHIFLSFDIKVSEQTFKYAKYGNFFCFMLQTFMVFYALFAIKDLLSNLFSMGQSSNKLYQIEKEGQIHNLYNTSEELASNKENKFFVYFFMVILYLIKFLKNVLRIFRRSA